MNHTGSQEFWNHLKLIHKNREKATHNKFSCLGLLKVALKSITCFCIMIGMITSIQSDHSFSLRRDMSSNTKKKLKLSLNPKASSSSGSTLRATKEHVSAKECSSSSPAEAFPLRFPMVAPQFPTFQYLLKKHYRNHKRPLPRLMTRVVPLC